MDNFSSFAIFGLVVIFTLVLLFIIPPLPKISKCEGLFEMHERVLAPGKIEVTITSKHMYKNNAGECAGSYKVLYDNGIDNVLSSKLLEKLQ
ncbi:MAG: hypothetical protein COA52_00395 [Hyphomicrobiales bacterium]|nr:MAG: hypothetical protein COA52_00395 [Hyphomicrobiales bacterium]